MHGALSPRDVSVNVIPWEYNEVPVLIAAAMATNAHIVALHLTRRRSRSCRAVLGIAPYFDAARGAYLLRDYRAGQPRMGTILVQGSVSTANVVKLLPKLDEQGLNVKLVAAVSPELFWLQPKSYQESILSQGDRIDMTYITNGSRRLMRDWVTHRLADEYAMSSDFDNRWRTGWHRGRGLRGERTCRHLAARGASSASSPSAISASRARRRNSARRRSRLSPAPGPTAAAAQAAAGWPAGGRPRARRAGCATGAGRQPPPPPG